MVTFMLFRFVGVAGLVFAISGCSGPSRRARHQADLPISPLEPYVRIEETNTNQIQLQIAAREFLPPHRNQPVIWLTGVSHIGDSKYYARLQAHLDAQSLVLYEGVGAAQADPATVEAPASNTVSRDSSGPRAAPASTDRGSLQSAMAASLGLVFQLEAIDYSRDNFRNSDLSVNQLRDLMSESQTDSAGPGPGESFEDLMQLMQGNSWFDALLQMALRLLGTNPKFQALGRLALIDLLGQIQGDPSRLQGLPPDMKQLLEVLLQRLNDKVLSDLKSEVAKLGRHDSVAVFFGTGHMPDLEMKLRSQLKYRPERQIWFTVFQVDLAAAKISPSERQLIDSFVKWQLQAAGASSGAGK